jgi:hypothetical protein
VAPRLPHKITITNPGPPAISPTTGNEVAGEPVTVSSRAYLSQRPVENLSSAIEINGAQTTVVSLYTLLVPPDAPLRADSVITDVATGSRYEVEGNPATRERSPYLAGAGRPYYAAAALRRISDLQGV